MSRPGTALLARCAPPRRRIAGLLGWSAVEAAPALVSGLAVAHAVDAFRSGRPGPALAWLAAPALAVAVGAWATTRLYRVLAVVVEEVRDRLSTAVVDGELRRLGLAGRRTSAPFTQLTDQIDQVRNLLSAQLRSLRSTVTPLVAALVGLAFLNPLLAVAVLVPTAAGLLLYAVLLPTVVGASRADAIAEERLGAEVTGLMDALPHLRGLGVSGWAGDRLAAATSSAAQAQLRLARIQAARRLIVAIGAHAPLLGILLVGARLRVGVGDLVGATTYVLTVSAPALRALVNAGGAWFVQLVVVLDRLAAVADRPDGDPDARFGTESDGAPHVVAEGLSFAYRPEARAVLDRLDLRLPAGSLLAVAGPSGAGKSTFARLVAGTIAPTAGSVGLRAGTRVCLLPQEAYVFHGTLRENLSYLAPGPVDDALLRSSAETFGLTIDLDDEIHAADLNPAQRQQVVLARAHLSDADLVVLDEATSHLDAAAERAAEEALRTGGRTLIVIAHGSDVTTRADQVLRIAP